jgi:hypothetical protein
VLPPTPYSSCSHTRSLPGKRWWWPQVHLRSYYTIITNAYRFCIESPFVLASAFVLFNVWESTRWDVRVLWGQRRERERERVRRNRYGWFLLLSCPPSIFRILRVLLSPSRTCMSLGSWYDDPPRPPSPYVLPLFFAFLPSHFRMMCSCSPGLFSSLFLLPRRSLMWGEGNCSLFLPRQSFFFVIVFVRL